ncbi:hypothetical protein BDV93DRAFT_560430 [Ceratobasidium sp. AG-I]|nr:hypothetical protein BDV93DRAFT_560430 [Ceratobasidium sp. AG-I]
MPPEREHDDEELEVDHSKLLVHSRQMTRLEDMYWNAHDILKLTKTWQRKNPAQRAAFEASASDDIKRNLALAKFFIQLDPGVVEELCRGGRGSRSLMELSKTLLSKGQSNAKAEDMRKVKALLALWRTWTPQLDPNDQSGRGLKHPETAFYLSSLEVDWDNEEERRSFRAGEVLMSEFEYPRLCYKDGIGDKDRPWVGAFYGQLLIKGARAIIFSPASSKDATPTMTACGSRGHRRIPGTRSLIGLAKRYDMNEVTIPFIAYVTVVVRHALTAEKEYSDDGSGFDYVIFYNEIRSFLEDPKYKQVATKLIKYWNAELFGELNRCRIARAAKGSARGTRTLLDAALEAGDDLGMGDEEETDEVGTGE